MLSKSEKHTTNVDLAAVLQHDDQHDTTTRAPTVPTKSSSVPAKRLKKKHDTSHAVAPTRKQEDLPLAHTVGSSVAHESIWNSYKKLYSIQFGNGPYFPVARRTKLQPDGNSLCLVKTFSGADVEKHIHAIRRIKHQQFVQARKYFSTQNESSVAFEYMPVSLAEVEGNPLLGDLELASILGQVCCATSTASKFTAEKFRWWKVCCT